MLPFEVLSQSSATKFSLDIDGMQKLKLASPILVPLSLLAARLSNRFKCAALHRTQHPLQLPI